jgi:ribosome-associated protein
VNAIANSVQKVVSKELKDKPWHIEGSENAEWILMDYVSIVVHVFQKQIREYYNIESLWGDAVITSIENKY